MTRTVIVSNDIIPGMGLPVAAPGLRAHGLAAGLREHGVDATIVALRHVVDRRWSRAVAPVTPLGATLVQAGSLQRWLEADRPDAVVFINANVMADIEPIDGVRFVYDLFAPKMLELESQPKGPTSDTQLEALRQRKLRALQRADAVIVNGEKKVPYAQQWLEAAGRPELPLRIVVMPVTPRPAPSEPDHVRFVSTGYLQPWARPGPWARALAPLLRHPDVSLDLVIGNHWGGRAPGTEHAGFRALSEQPGVRRHRLMEFGDFQRFLSQTSVAIDVFQRNAEREMAMVTRAVVAVSCGVPVIHPAFTELSPLLEGHGAGWLVDPDDERALGDLFAAIVEDPQMRRARREGARRLAAEVFEPRVATAPLADLLQTLCGSRDAAA